MNRAEIRDMAKSLVDGDFEESRWDTWINMGINAVSNGVTEGFRRVVKLIIINSEVKIPTYMTSIKEVYLQNSTGGWDRLPYYQIPRDASVDDKYYYLEDNKLKTSWATESDVVEVHGECSAVPLTSDTASPDFISPEFHDVISLYAAMLSQIYDDEDVKQQALNKLYTSRLSMLITKIKSSHRGGKRLYGFTNGVIYSGR